MSLHDTRPYPEECERVRELLGAREDGPLAPGEEVMLSDHLDACESCQQVASWMPSIDGLARHGPKVPRPDDDYFASVRASVMAKVAAASHQPAAQGTSRRPWLRWPVLAPTALVVVLVGLVTLRQGERAGTIDQLATAPERGQSVEGAASTGLQQPAEEEADTEQPVADAAAPAPAPAAVTGRDKDQGADFRQETSLTQRFDETVLSKRETPRIESAPASLPAPAATGEPLALRPAFELALASQDTPSEPDALARLLDALESSTAEYDVEGKLEAELSSRSRRVAQPLGRTMSDDASFATASTLTDSIAVHLEQRSEQLPDDALRARILAWLRSR